MKKIMTLVAMVVLMASAFGQEQKLLQKTISVNGSAEKEIVPDEIYVQVDLREYNKKNGGKVDINNIKNNFLAACKSIGLADKDVTVQGYQGYDQNYWWAKKNKKQNPDMKAGISYWIKVNNVSNIKAAKEKAIYLSEAIGEHVGDVTTITDPVEVDNTPRPYYANVLMKDAENVAGTPALDVDFKKIKVRFEVNLVFALK